jgi:membrane-associated protease RseP (regulator of RpoE activity)
LSLPLPPVADDPFAPHGDRPEPFFFEMRPAPARSWWKEWGRNVLLFVLTALSVYATQAFWWGGGHRDGLLLMTALMSILLAHEMGHYVACRHYRVDATLPFFLPVPVISLVGTLGAFIRIRSRFPNRRALFDIGIAGPLAGFAVCLPVLVLGLREARVLPTPSDSPLLEFADPLLMQWTISWIKGAIPEGHTVFIGPLGLAAWFGLLVTALNLIPVGQLDGGHVTYALFGRRAD